jgi:small subunit ribosomal protein S6
MRVYEELFIMKPDIPEEEVAIFIEQIKTNISTAGGTVDKVENWGKRRLAYKVEKCKEGTYVLVQFSSGPEAVKEVERRLRVADGVIKFLTVRIDESLKRIEKRKKEREKRAHRRATSPRPESASQQVAPMFGEPEAHAAPGLPPAPPTAAPQQTPATPQLAPAAAPQQAPAAPEATAVPVAAEEGK